MLDIVVSYHCMQFQRKLMNQIWENGKKTSFGSNFGTFSPNLGRQFFFQKSGCQLPDVMVIYHHVQYKNKLIIQSWENLVTDGRTDWWTERTEGQEWFHSMLSDQRRASKNVFVISSNAIFRINDNLDYGPSAFKDKLGRLLLMLE